MMSGNNCSASDVFFEHEKKIINFYKKLDPNATSNVYVEGIPIDATEREVSHIFRPYPGYKGLRLIEKEKNGKKTFIGFVDFENVIQSTVCINTLQGYRFDKNDLLGLHLSYGVKRGNI